MDLGAFTSGLLTGLREGVEAALILAIICAYLAKTGNRQYFPEVFVGAGLAAVVLSAVIGVVLFVDRRQLPGAIRAALRRATMLIVGASVVTWMLFWMRRQAAQRQGRAPGGGRSCARRRIGDGPRRPRLRRGHPRRRRDLAVPRRPGGRRVRPRVARSGSSSARSSASASPAVLGVGFYHGSRRINLGTFFRWTGVALVFIAAGLLSHAVHEFIEIGLINVGTQTLFDVSAILPARRRWRQRPRPVAPRAVRVHLDARGRDVRRLADLRRRGPDPVPCGRSSGHARLASAPWRPVGDRGRRDPGQKGKIAPRSGSASLSPNRKIVPTNRLNRPATAPIAT